MQFLMELGNGGQERVQLYQRSDFFWELSLVIFVATYVAVLAHSLILSTFSTLQRLWKIPEAEEVLVEG